MAGDLLIIQSCDEGFLRYLNLSRPVHDDYATRCGADYRFFLGRKDPVVHPAWNRIPMFLEAFDEGYRKVVYLDGDTLVTNPNISIFAETDDIVPFQMTRPLDSHVEIPWTERGWDIYNDGVIVANNTPEARSCFEYVWDQRHAAPKAHHHPTLWELNHISDVLIANPDWVTLLEQRFNWQPFREAPPESTAVIHAWHGVDHEPRFLLFAEKYAEIYGAAV